MCALNVIVQISRHDTGHNSENLRGHFFLREFKGKVINHDIERSLRRLISQRVKKFCRIGRHGYVDDASVIPFKERQKIFRQLKRSEEIDGVNVQ